MDIGSLVNMYFIVLGGESVSTNKIGRSGPKGWHIPTRTSTDCVTHTLGV